MKSSFSVLQRSASSSRLLLEGDRESIVEPVGIFDGFEFHGFTFAVLALISWPALSAYGPGITMSELTNTSNRVPGGIVTVFGRLRYGWRTRELVLFIWPPAELAAIIPICCSGFV